MKLPGKFTLFVFVFFAALAAISFTSCMRSGTLATIKITPADPIMVEGSTQQFTATATFTDGTVLNWTTAVKWASEDEAVVAISNEVGSKGLATALTSTIVTITAIDTINGISDTTSIRVKNSPLQSIAVTPSNPPDLKVGESLEFTATGTYADATTETLTSLLTWSSSNTGVATVNSTEGKIIVTAVSPGSATITAAESATGFSESANINVVE